MASVPLIVVGGVVQGVGFVIALRQAATIRREEAPDHLSLPKQTWALIARQVERVLVLAKLRRPRGQTAHLAGTAGMKIGGTARFRVRRVGIPIDERLDAIEGDVEDLRVKQAQDHATLERRIEGVSAEAKAVAERLETERKQRLTRSLDWEEAGIWTFIAGLFLTVLGAVA